MIKNIIFDWSGVIDDNLKACHLTAMEIFKIYGIKPISLKEYRREWEQPYMLFYKKYIPNITIEEQKTIYKKNIQRFDHRLYPEIRRLLKQFKKAKIKLIILSGDPLEKINQDINDFNLENIFDKIYDDVHDKTTVIKNLIRDNQLKPNETIFIGDTTHETKTGKLAGIKTASVTWGFQTEEKLKTAKPDFMIHNIKELRNLILDH